jgi:hypothetical protein
MPHGILRASPMAQCGQSEPDRFPFGRVEIPDRLAECREIEGHRNLSGSFLELLSELVGVTRAVSPAARSDGLTLCPGFRHVATASLPRLAFCLAMFPFVCSGGARHEHRTPQGRRRVRPQKPSPAAQILRHRLAQNLQTVVSAADTRGWDRRHSQGCRRPNLSPLGSGLLGTFLKTGAGQR